MALACRDAVIRTDRFETVGDVEDLLLQLALRARTAVGLQQHHQTILTVHLCP